MFHWPSGGQTPPGTWRLELPSSLRLQCSHLQTIMMMMMMMMVMMLVVVVVVVVVMVMMTPVGWRWRRR